MKLSVVIPVYNEAATLKELLESVAAVDAGIEKEIVIVDDCSTDGTREVLKALAVELLDRVKKVETTPAAPVDVEAVVRKVLSDLGNTTTGPAPAAPAATA